ncbi:hypothetical protein A2Y47_00725 [Candidatus Giovannonibacteria bacterium RIFCSPLOWO2_12_43_8]|uniref:DUF4870 domain-containing protein n=1 Tax=Candidatus Giovannonibacteria bacterium RIFCSPLOWO2_12_43_8 TaxID=1798361 RepID=A0A1F5Y359_9BACT|nr:MAG: hypothetical protein A2Y47_00725 [Candidatus Giovannonibacteria bacterium RIFCSPLOWO2_12_43_8]
METPQSSAPHDNKLMGILAYLGPFIIVSYIVAKDDPFVKFHIKQGLVLFVIEVAVWFIGRMFWPFWMILNIVNLSVLILAIIGIVNAAHGEEKELPVVGKYSSHFPI